MKQSIVRMLLCAGALLPESVVLAEDPGEASLTVSGPTTGTGAEEHDKAATSNAASAATPDIGAQLAALQKQLDAMKEEMETQKALAEAGNSDQLTAKTDIFRLYGWMDMGFNKTWVDSRDSLNVMLPTKGGTFVLGNINLYLDIQPSENWSALVEVRVTNLTNTTQWAALPGGSYSRVSSNTMDTSATIPWTFVDLASIVLERAYIQYRYNDLLQLRVGSFLTPFGIWNVDHGTPTLIALALPLFITQRIFPSTQLGAQLLGNTLVGSWDLGYSLTVSNGKNASSNYDPTDDKMFGGRITARTSHPWRLQLGLSGLTGRYSDTQSSVTYTPFSSQFNEVVAYREIDTGLDLSLDIGAFRLRSELSRSQRVYDQGKRDVDVWSTGFGQSADVVVWDWYLLAAYRLPWIPVEPYLYYEYYRWPSGLGEGYMSPSVGVNVYFTTYAQLKLQYIKHLYFKELSSLDRTPEYDKSIFVARLVLGF